MNMYSWHIFCSGLQTKSLMYDLRSIGFLLSMNANTCLIGACLVFCFHWSSAVSSVHSGVHTLVCPFLNPPPQCLQNSNCKYPMPLEFKIKEPPLPSEFKKVICVIGIDVFCLASSILASTQPYRNAREPVTAFSPLRGVIIK